MVLKRFILIPLRILSRLFAATAFACAMVMEWLLHFFRQLIHKPPLRFLIFPFHFSNNFLNLHASKIFCTPMAVNKNLCSEPMNNLLNFNQNSPVSTVPLAQNATNDKTTPKVKLLCSFGGKFMPQRNDENLRYIGGQSRIISICRDTTIHEFYCKMHDVYGGPVRICYQLSDESLDTLVSVYSIEDFENMMKKIDYLSKTSKCESTKLRVFLFFSFNMKDHSDKFNIVFNDCELSYINTTNKVFAFDTNVNGRNSKAGTKHATSTANLNVRGERFINEGNDNILALEHQKFSAHSNVVRTSIMGNQFGKDIRRYPTQQQQPHGFTTYDSALKSLRFQLSSIFNIDPLNNIN